MTKHGQMFRISTNAYECCCMDDLMKSSVWKFLWKFDTKGEYSKLHIEHMGEKSIIAYKGMSKVMSEKSYYSGNAPLDNYSQLFYVNMGLKSVCTYFFSII